MDKVKDYLTEVQTVKDLIATPGSNLEEINFDGQIVYTSKTLKENVKKAVYKNLSKQSSLIVIRMIDNETLTPVFISKGIIDYFRKRRKILGHSLGTVRNGRAYIFVDTLYQRFKLTSINEKFLSRLILHELMHVSDHLNLSGFIKINKDLITNFWKFFFTNYLDLNISVPLNLFEKIIIAQAKISRRKGNWNNDEIFGLLIKKLKDHSSLDEKEYDNLWEDLYNYLDNFVDVGSPKVIPGNIASSKKYAYTKIAGNDSQTFGQELWSVSEILSVISEINPDHPNVIKTLRLLI